MSPDCFSLLRTKMKKCENSLYVMVQCVQCLFWLKKHRYRTDEQTWEWGSKQILQSSYLPILWIFPHTLFSCIDDNKFTRCSFELFFLRPWTSLSLCDFGICYNKYVLNNWSDHTVTNLIVCCCRCHYFRRNPHLFSLFEWQS